MSPRRISWTLALALVPTVVSASRASDLNFTTNIDDSKRIISCSDVQMKFWKYRAGEDGFVTARREQTIALHADPSTPLKVKATERGGIRVQPSSDGTFSALVCMAAGAKSDASAEEILGHVSVKNDGGELRLDGPESEDWGACIILSVPSAVSLDLSALDGGLALREVEGHFTLRTTNGPISLVSVGGVVDGRTVNGPIHYCGHSGDIRLSAANGPVDVELDAPAWIGKGLEGSAENGPVQLKMPADLRMGVRVEGSAASPVQWNGASLLPSQDQPGASRSYRFGEGPVVVHLSTGNGPLQIRGPRRPSRGVKI